MNKYNETKAKSEQATWAEMNRFSITICDWEIKYEYEINQPVFDNKDTGCVRGVLDRLRPETKAFLVNAAKQILEASGAAAHEGIGEGTPAS